MALPIRPWNPAISPAGSSEPPTSSSESEPESESSDGGGRAGGRTWRLTSHRRSAREFGTEAVRPASANEATQQ